VVPPLFVIILLL